MLLHSFERNGETFNVYHDDFHEVRGSFALDTEEETRQAEDETLEKIANGEWVVVYVTVTTPCRECGHHGAVDTLSGIVITANEEAFEREIPGIMGRED